ncbi:hypothetical protein P5G51_014335 [Virgibacillus sp. 179-BFC.A HS]|uniref:Uncharacterized protein n=1 Tax=Tigheibacillus jepli TaxID=3035914 RepID=A0ABU5CJD4_9BACI|nr:hypothetical protein [Virgibacillus sp. 179-BFC.A HS]MDY0406411.1 hypothetical protein [Virgibacillus sp. 179-BFC.A HS]
MSVELLTEFINDISPFYFYLSILLSAVSVMHIANVHLQRFMHKANFYTEGQAPKEQAPPVPEQINDTRGVRNWITLKVKRMEAPKEDADLPSKSATNSLMFIFQGGLRWRKNLYSLSLKNMA